MKLRVIILSQSSVMEYRNPHLAVLAAAKDGFTDCCSEGFAGPKAVQDMKDALSGTFAEQRCRDIAPLVQFTCTFQKIQVINSVFLYRFTSYAGQFIGYGEKPVKVSGRLLIQVFINLKRAALYTVPAALAEESLSLLFRQFGDTFLKAFEPIL